MIVSPLTGRTQILAEHDNLEPSNRLLLSPCDVCQAGTILTFGSPKSLSNLPSPVPATFYLTSSPLLLLAMSAWSPSLSLV